MSKTFEAYRTRRDPTPEGRISRLPARLPDRDELLERLNEATRDRNEAEKQRDDALRLMAEVLAELDKVNRETYRMMQLPGVPQDVIERLEAPAPWPMDSSRSDCPKGATSEENERGCRGEIAPNAGVRRGPWPC